MSETVIHHPSCPARHGEGECTWYCGPDETRDQTHLARTPDAMLLDIRSHSDAAAISWAGLKEGPVARRLRLRDLKARGVRA